MLCLDHSPSSRGQEAISRSRVLAAMRGMRWVLLLPGSQLWAACCVQPGNDSLLEFSLSSGYSWREGFSATHYSARAGICPWSPVACSAQVGDVQARGSAVIPALPLPPSWGFSLSLF